MNKTKMVVAGCCKNVGRFLPKLFNNIDQLRSLFDIKVIFAHDHSSDNTLTQLESYYFKNLDNCKILLCDNRQPERTVRIASARNSIMDFVKRNYAEHDLLCFLDMDDIINAPFNLSTFTKAIDLWDKWDALSFNRTGYYDIWALRYEPYILPCWSWGKDSHKAVVHIQNDVISKLDLLRDDELLPVKSAFNGIALFKIEKFYNIRFNGLFKTLYYQNPFPFIHIPPYDDCEWVNFHENARIVHPDLRVMVSPLKPY